MSGHESILRAVWSTSPLSDVPQTLPKMWPPRSWLAPSPLLKGNCAEESRLEWGLEVTQSFIGFPSQQFIVLLPKGMAESRLMGLLKLQWPNPLGKVIWYINNMWHWVISHIWTVYVPWTYISTVQSYVHIPRWERLNLHRQQASCHFLRLHHPHLPRVLRSHLLVQCQARE